MRLLLGRDLPRSTVSEATIALFLRRKQHRLLRRAQMSLRNKDRDDACDLEEKLDACPQTLETLHFASFSVLGARP